MKRRAFIAALGGAAAWPVVGRAQSAIPAIGYLHTASRGANARFAAAFVAGLQNMGMSEGKNFIVEYRWADGQYDKLPALVSDLIGHNVALILAAGGTAPAFAAKTSTQTVPIVFVSGDDPVRQGLISSLNRPGGNITGVVFFNSALAAKRLELLCELIPAANSIAYLTNPLSPNAISEEKDVEDAANKLNVTLHTMRAATRQDIEQAFIELEKVPVKALLVAADPALGGYRELVNSLAVRVRLPAIGPTREFVATGGLATYTTSISDAYHKAGVYAGRILRGVNPSDLPVEQPTKFELVVNLRTARTLGLNIPPTVLARTDEVIE